VGYFGDLLALLPGSRSAQVTSAEPLGSGGSCASSLGDNGSKGRTQTCPQRSNALWGEYSRPPMFFGLARQRSEISHTYFIVSELVACFPALQSA